MPRLAARCGQTTPFRPEGPERPSVCLLSQTARRNCPSRAVPTRGAGCIVRLLGAAGRGDVRRGGGRPPLGGRPATGVGSRVWPPLAAKRAVLALSGQNRPPCACCPKHQQGMAAERPSRRPVLLGEWWGGYGGYTPHRGRSWPAPGGPWPATGGGAGPVRAGDGC